jgi:hypothetical protein
VASAPAQPRRKRKQPSGRDAVPVACRLFAERHRKAAYRSIIYTRKALNRRVSTAAPHPVRKSPGLPYRAAAEASHRERGLPTARKRLRSCEHLSDSRFLLPFDRLCVPETLLLGYSIATGKNKCIGNPETIRANPLSSLWPTRPSYGWSYQRASVFDCPQKALPHAGRQEICGATTILRSRERSRFGGSSGRQYAVRRYARCLTSRGDSPNRIEFPSAVH